MNVEPETELAICTCRHTFSEHTGTVPLGSTTTPCIRCDCRRFNLAPEPDSDDPIKDLIPSVGEQKDPFFYGYTEEMVNKFSQIAHEAYRRGQEYVIDHPTEFLRESDAGNVTLENLFKWQRRMFRAPELDDPVKDLMVPVSKGLGDPKEWNSVKAGDDINHRIREAFERGKAAK